MAKFGIRALPAYFTAAAAISAPASTFFVTEATDTTNGTSLRGAIISANASGGTSIIVLSNAAYALDIPDAGEGTAFTGDLDITNGSITIIGSSQSQAVINASGLGDRVFEVFSNAQLTLVNLLITGGTPPGGIYTSWNEGQSGGAIYNQGTLRLENCIVSNNASGGGNYLMGNGGGTGGGSGGGIYSSGVLTMTHCLITANVAGGGADGAFGGNGGGIYSSGICILTSCAVTDNSAGSGGQPQGNAFGFAGAGGSGGGIFNLGTAVLVTCSLSDNLAGSGGTGGQQGIVGPFGAPGGWGGAGGSGGGAYNGGELWLIGCLMSRNSCGDGGDGGQGVGLYGSGGGPGAGGSGAGIYNVGRLDLETCTVGDNHCGTGGNERLADVILFDAADEAYSIGFNILTAHSDLEKTLLASDLISVFQRLSSSWGDQMASVMQNAILAFLESSRGGTLADLRRFLLDAEFRNEFLTTVTDPDLIYYWRKGFPQLGGNKSIGPVLTRLETFLAPKPVRYIVSQQANRLDFADIMDSGKIILAKLPQGQIGKENAFLLGSLLMSKFQQTAMSRQAQHIAARRDFWLYLDECHHFITPSTAEIVSGARKYRMGLTLAHQELRQLQRDSEVASAVMNCGTRIVFRLGDDDARKLADGFATFEARDLQNLDTGQAICRVERSDFDFNLAVPLPAEPDEAVARERRQAIIAASRQKYATPRAEVEAMLASKIQQVRPPTPPATQAPAVAAPISPEPVDVPKPLEPTAPPVVEPKLPEIVPLVVAPVSKPAVAVEKKPPGPPTDLGKGGEQHKAMQQRIKDAADTLGFRSVIEKQIGESQESIDLFLERGDQQIACEISVSTTIDHEIGNVRKCLKAGVPRVAIICVSQDRLQKIAAAVTGSLGAEASARVAYYEPDQFIAHLKTLPIPMPEDAVTTHHGYKVKRSAPQLTAEERRQREDTANRMLAEAMRPKR